MIGSLPYRLHYASDIAIFSDVPEKPRRRSGCPVSISLDTLGDRWSLLVIRDLMVRGYTRFKQFEESDERIATNILADRLRRLQRNGLSSRSRTRTTDGERVTGSPKRA